MIVSLLVAMDEKGGIGKDNRLPWRLSADLRRFKELTMGHYLIMGRKTYESIGRPLPGRITIVVTRQPTTSTMANGPLPCQPPDCLLAHSIDEALALAEAHGETEVFVIGGAEIFALALPRANRIYLTQVHAETQVDVYFPSLLAEEWVEQGSDYHPADEKNQYAFSFKQWVRKRVSN